MAEFVNTVLGPVSASDLGVTLVHEHLTVGWPGWEADTVHPFDRDAAIAACCERLGTLKDLGVRTFVDPCPGDLGRDVEFMAECARRSGMNVIAATGFYVESLGGSHFRSRQLYGVDIVPEIEEVYVREIEHGVGSTGIRPGVIKCATGSGAITRYEEAVLRAAARAHRRTGTPLITHTDNGSLGDRQLDIFFEEGVAPDRIAIGHSDDRADLAYHAAILDRGAFLSFDRFGLDDLFPNKLRLASLIALIGVGYGSQMLVSHDSVCRWKGRPEPGPIVADWEPTFIFRSIIPKLRAAGVTSEAIDTLLIDNPRRFLAGV